jgi:hypothetical protein
MTPNIYSSLLTHEHRATYDLLVSKGVTVAHNYLWPMTSKANDFNYRTDTVNNTLELILREFHPLYKSPNVYLQVGIDFKRRLIDMWNNSQKIDAIKELRSTLGCGLLEAKNTVEMLGTETNNTTTKENNMNFDNSNRTAAFWIVWSPSSANNPKMQHPSEFAATTEAERLAKLNPGSTFYAMRACTQSVISAVQTTRLG